METSHLSFFPAPVIGETVYSWLSRYHLWSGHNSFRKHSLAIFGVNEQQAAAEFPCYLTQLSKLSGVDFDWIIQHMTDCQFYKPFVSKDIYQNTINSLQSGDTGALQSKLGMVANRLTPGRQLWCCPACIQQDVTKHGFPVWHVEHQVTGVISCPIHHMLLSEIRKIRSRATFPESTETNYSNEMSDNYSQLINDELHSKEIFSSASLLLTYQQGLKRIGLLTDHNQLRLKLLKSLLGENLVDMKDFVGYQQIIHALEHQYPECLFYRSTALHHPLKHLVFIHAIFGNWHVFKELYLNIEKAGVQESSTNREPTQRSNIQLNKRAKAALKAGDSLRSVSHVMGISVSTMKILAQQEGIHVDTRPYKIFLRTERAIWRKLFVGISCSDIASSFDISTGAVEQILRKHQYLKALRKNIWFYQNQKKHRNELSHHLLLNPSHSRKKIRKCCGGAYIWLYRHDKQWLFITLPAKAKRIYWPRKKK
jgi:predicted DNA-binding protein YlxM (UPF0122 family)